MVRAYLVDAVTKRTIGTLDYEPDNIPEPLVELLAGLDTPRTYSIEKMKDGVPTLYTGVRVRSTEEPRDDTL